jgi:hypothetical protein
MREGLSHEAISSSGRHRRDHQPARHEELMIMAD